MRGRNAPSTTALSRYALAASVDAKPFIQRVIDEATKKFVSGYTIMDSEIKRVQADSELQKKYKIYEKEKLLYLKDDKFTSWEANCITGTNFIAARGPVVIGDIKSLMADTAFHPSLQIKSIVVLSSDFISQDDFTTPGVVYDYCVSPPPMQCGDYNVECKSDAKSSYDKQTKVTKLNGVATSKLTVQKMVTGADSKRTSVDTKELDVTVIGLPDGRSFELKDEAIDIKEKFLSLYEKSLQEKIFVHCLAGCGRTGLLILMLELTKQYSNVFNSPKPEVVAANIHLVLNRLRTTRPGLVFTEDQFAAAIRNAKVLHDYRLEKQAKLRAEIEMKKQAELLATNEQNKAKAAPVKVYATRMGAFAFLVYVAKQPLKVADKPPHGLPQASAKR